MEHYNISEAIETQERYCKKNKYPLFAPDSGVCPNCNKNIYEKIKRNGTSIERGISVEAAGTNLITGCPHCSWSFCD
jgi:hypothetical protein